MCVCGEGEVGGGGVDGGVSGQKVASMHVLLWI